MLDVRLRRCLLVLHWIYVVSYVMCVVCIYMQCSAQDIWSGGWILHEFSAVYPVYTCS